MELKVKTCYSRLMSFMLYSGSDLEDAVSSVEFSSPEFRHEGMAGHIETNVVFKIKDLTRFTELWDKSFVFPSDKTAFYHTLRNGKFGTK